MPDTFDQVVAILRDHATNPHRAGDRDARLKGDLGFDSLDAFEVAMVVEDQFGINLDDDAKIMACVTVGDFADLVAAQIALKHARAS